MKYERIYVHVPFCGSKCGYCAFYSVPRADSSLIEAYVEKTCDEIARSADKCSPLRSIYFGGGTPTYLGAGELGKIFDAFRRGHGFAPDCEISVECNPETADVSRCEEVAKFANRISFGVQSFGERFRKILGRRGGEDDFRRAHGLFKERGIRNFSCDLIYSVPGQTAEDFREDLEKFVATGIRHLSAYALTAEEGARLAAEASVRQDDELEIAMWNAAEEVLSSGGIGRYEISNYAAAGAECGHNMDIWHGARYLGLGPAASSFDGEKRWTQAPDLKRWLGGEPPEEDVIPRRKRAAEILAFGLRTVRGWDSELFSGRTGFDLPEWEVTFAKLAEEGLVDFGGDFARCTPRGLLLWNDVAEALLA